MSTITTTQRKRKLNLSPITVRVLSSPYVSPKHPNCKNNSNTGPNPPDDEPAPPSPPNPPNPQREGAA
jgi:hypothetical protein